MERLNSIFIVFIFFSFAIPASWKTNKKSANNLLEISALKKSPQKIATTPFIHPGGWITSADIQRIRGKLAPWGNNIEPWSSAKKSLMSTSIPYYNYQPSPRAMVDRGSTNINLSAFNTDVQNVYTLMIKWIATNDSRYGDAAIRVIDDWSGTLLEITGKDARLCAGIDGSKFAQAAELAAYYKPGWPNKARAQKMFKDIFYPICWNNGHGASSNWGTSCMAGIISMGVFCDDTIMFNNAVSAYKNGWPITGKDGCAGVTQYIDETGECSESGRDQPHTQGGIAHLIETAVTAWNQGINLFTYGNNRVVNGLEYTSKYNLGNSVDWHPFVDPCNLNNRWPTISIAGRGRYSPVYEMAYSYFKLLGFLPLFTKQVRESKGYAPEKTNLDHPGWGTLCFTR